ncbi:uncharacterized protein LOC119466233 isoform X1 [Dermacentor silvarum]|uniref:uncharacterized protein LOC119466233 isoform X1 n=1 Tax=Dermacentor silvarum TaxID=543639 RepID=UPI00189BA7F6|nr:uncharacterized protein LOC119466233 isoform X1 [Dermacentor silvarum]
MKHQVAAVFLILCFTSAAVNANEAVDAVVEQLKNLVRQYVKDQAKADEYLSKIDSASECLSVAKDMNPEIINRFAKGVIPTAIACGGEHISIEDPQQRATAIKDCLLEKANQFKESSGMTPDEKKMFDDASACIQKVAEGVV